MRRPLARRLVRLRNLVAFPLSWPLRLLGLGSPTNHLQKEIRDHAHAR